MKDAVTNDVYKSSCLSLFQLDDVYKDLCQFLLQLVCGRKWERRTIHSSEGKLHVKRTFSRAFCALTDMKVTCQDVEKELCGAVYRKADKETVVRRREIDKKYNTSEIVYTKKQLSCGCLFQKENAFSRERS